MMTRKFLIIAGCVVLSAAISSCGDGTHREPGRAYAPDMTYSNAYETYAPAQERLKASGVAGEVHYTGRPVDGTIARGDMKAYSLKNDSLGYAQSAAIKSPVAVGSVNMKEAERLYLVNCGICHGAKLDGNGPLWKDGNGPYSAAPKNLMDATMKSMPEGTMFHSVTYGKGQMGSYASQLNTQQRWEVIAYIKSKQFPGGAASAADSTAKSAVDSAAVVTTK